MNPDGSIDIAWRGQTPWQAVELSNPAEPLDLTDVPDVQLERVLAGLLAEDEAAELTVAGAREDLCNLCQATSHGRRDGDQWDACCAACAEPVQMTNPITEDRPPMSSTYLDDASRAALHGAWDVMDGQTPEGEPVRPSGATQSMSLEEEMDRDEADRLDRFSGGAEIVSAWPREAA